MSSSQNPDIDTQKKILKKVLLYIKNHESDKYNETKNYLNQEDTNIESIADELVNILGKSTDTVWIDGENLKKKLLDRSFHMDVLSIAANQLASVFINESHTEDEKIIDFHIKRARDALTGSNEMRFDVLKDVYEALGVSTFQQLRQIKRLDIVNDPLPEYLYKTVIKDALLLKQQTHNGIPNTWNSLKNRIFDSLDAIRNWKHTEPSKLEKFKRLFSKFFEKEQKGKHPAVHGSNEE